MPSATTASRRGGTSRAPSRMRASTTQHGAGPSRLGLVEGADAGAGLEALLGVLCLRRVTRWGGHTLASRTCPTRPDNHVHTHLRTRPRRRRSAAAPGEMNRDDQALGARPAASPPGRWPGNGQTRVKGPARAARHRGCAHPHDHDRTLAATGGRDATRTRCRRTPVSGVFPALLLVGGNTESRPNRRSGCRDTVTTPSRQLLASRSGLVTAP